MSPATMSATDPKMWRLGEDLVAARETLRLLDEDEKTLERILKVEEARFHKLADARWRPYMKAFHIFYPWGRVGWMLIGMIGRLLPDPRARDIARILLDPVNDELAAVRKRRDAAWNEVQRLESMEQAPKLIEEALKWRRDETRRALWRSDEETTRRFEAPGRVRTALTRMVADVFATIRRQDEALDAADYDEFCRLREVETAQRVQLHGLWRIDPLRHSQGTWTAVTKEKRLPQGMGTDLPTLQAAHATRQRLVEARLRGCPSEIQRLEDEERVLEEMFGEMGGCIISHRFYPAGLLPAPGTTYGLPGMNGHRHRQEGEPGRRKEMIGGDAPGGR